MYNLNQVPGIGVLKIDRHNPDTATPAWKRMDRLSSVGCRTGTKVDEYHIFRVLFDVPSEYHHGKAMWTRQCAL